MFTSLHVAKKSGAITFQWSDTCVVVCGINLFSEPTYYGVCLINPGEDRTEAEYALAVAFGVVAEPAPWSPEQL